MATFIIYVIFGACLSAFVAGRCIPDADRGDDNAVRWLFIVVSTFAWPILLPAFFAFRAGKKRS